MTGLSRYLLLIAAAMTFVPAGVAWSIEIRSDAPAEYTVKKGDTLWDISSLFLNDPWKWPELWRLNPHVENPDLIYPGDTLKLTYTADGEPVLVMGK